MENQKLCQSCGMPMSMNEGIVKNKDGSLNEEYCSYCYQDGSFVAPKMTMEEMIQACAEYSEHWEPKVTRDEAVAQMREFFPTLKRWKND